MVLRDPPGSNSYSYLEQGVAVTESATYKGSVSNTGSEKFNTKIGVSSITWTGVGAGVINEIDQKSDFGVAVKHSEEVSGTSGKTSVTTTTTRFQTSSDPSFVGADGDLFVGYSTNISFGSTNNIKIIPGTIYNSDIYGDWLLKSADDKYYLIKDYGLGISQNFSTLFVYTQKHIEQSEIPRIMTLRNEMLMPKDSVADYQTMANTLKKSIYVSKLETSDPNFGKSNYDPVFGDNTSTIVSDGPSYKIYYPTTVPDTLKYKFAVDSINYLNQSIANWKLHLKKNEEAKVNAELKQNYSFESGSSVSYSESLSQSTQNTQSFNVAVGLEFTNEFGFQINNTGIIMELTEEVSTSHGADWSQSTDTIHTKGFELGDNGSSDYLSVDVCTEDGNKNSMFIFKTKAGATSCPYEGEYRTKYYSPGIVLNEATLQIEVPKIGVEKNFIENVPSGQPANFTLYLRNESEAKIDNMFDLKIVDEANPNGAKFVMDGAPIGNGRAIAVPAGQTVIKTLEVSKGTVMNYDSLELVFQSQCQSDINDTLRISVHFTPSCTDVNIDKPSNNWTYNTNLDTVRVNGLLKHYMDVVLNKFDVNYDNFDHIEIQYKPASGSEKDWVKLINYYSNIKLYNAAKANGLNADTIKVSDAGTIRYKWFLDDMPDQKYDLRAVSVCMVDGQEVTNSSEIKSGIKDMYRPRLFGSALPANGILTINDEIRLNFNEPIAQGYLTNNNFEVTGVRNGAKTDHSTSVRLDGVNDDLTTEFDRSWAGKDVTIEMWILADKAQSATFFSHGNVNNSLEFGITADNKLKVKINGKDIVSAGSVPYEQGSWAHVALVLEKTGFVTAFYNFKEYIPRATSGVYDGEGNCVFGRSIATGADRFAGKMHNARIWDKIVTSGVLQTNSLNLLSGNESNLMAYYPMNEARGTLLEDKARGANLLINGAVWTLPEGRSAAFNGKDQFVTLNTGSSVVITKAMDYTLEFWFKADATQTNATMVSNGRGDGVDWGGSENLFSLGFENSLLTFYNNNVKMTANGNYLDDNWHHLALSVNRNTACAQVVIDGVLKNYFVADSLGGIASADMFIGARGWRKDTLSTTYTMDNFFKGSIDDFRFWDLYKNERIVSQNNNEKLSGTEKGLKAYYPFEYYKEWQGIKELNFSLADMKVQRDPTVKIPDALYAGQSVEAKFNAPIKDKGPVSPLEYEFVVNNDALIIKMKEAPERIEKTIVTFTAEEIRDLNGNLTASPIIWSAYIDRNQLKWSDAELNLEKMVYQPMEFTSQITNKGGAIEHYTLENVPSWMTVTPSSGTINPSSSVKISFSVDEGLNVGSYNEVIYMRNEDNVSEALPVNLRVKGEKPNWTVNPADFKYSMAVFGKMRMNNIFSADKEDMLAVFKNGKCVGVANSSYDKSYDMWYAFLTVYSNERQSDGLEFRMWDASTGKIYLGVPDRAITFVNDAVIGSGTAPVIFDGKEMLFQNINLNKGWNWISFNLANPALQNLNTALVNGLWSGTDIIKTNDYFDSYSTATKTWVGTLSSNGGLNNTSLFMLYSSVPQVLSMNGTVINPSTLPMQIKGALWNYISYLPTTNFTVKEALAGYDAQDGDIIKSQNLFAMFSGKSWIGSLTTMEPGKGYMLKRTAQSNTSFNYPAYAGTLNSGTRMAIDEKLVEETFTNKNYAENMSVIAFSDQIYPGDRVIAFVDGELCGKSQSVGVNDKELQFISVSGKDKQGVVIFGLERNGRVVSYAVNRTAYEKDKVYGTVENPVKLDFNAEGISSLVYPNPFTSVVHVLVYTKPGDEIAINIISSTGHTVMKQPTIVAKDSLYMVEWNGSAMTQGLYLVNVYVNGKLTVHKIIKQ